MAGGFGTVDTAVWKHYVFKSLSDDAKLLFLYLKTCGHGNMIGCFHLPIMYICADLKWTDKKVKQTLTKLSDNGFVSVDLDVEFILLPKHLEKHPLQNDNQVTGARNLILDIPSSFSYLNEIIDIFNSQERVKEPLTNCQQRVTNSVSVSESVSVTKDNKRQNKYSDDDFRLSKSIFGKLKELNPNHKEPNLEKWANEIRLIRERDKNSLDEIMRLFTFANNHHFWKKNILSPANLRKHWDRLIIERDNENTSPGNRNPTGCIHSHKQTTNHIQLIFSECFRGLLLRCPRQ